MQRRLISLIESLANTASGFIVSVAVGLVIYPWFGVTFNVVQLSGITAIYTVLSVVRGFMVRRLFNHAHVRGWW